MQTVRQWLEQLGLPQYVEIFERNAVSLELLCELREGDLEKVGVPALAIAKSYPTPAELNSGMEPTVAIRACRAPIESIGAQAERRRLPVVFRDLLGLAPLATKVGAKPLHAELFHYGGLGACTPQSRSSSERRSC